MTTILLAQLLLPHTLPIALFSYRQERRFNRLESNALQATAVKGDDDSLSATPEVDYHGDVKTAQSWFPLLSFSPEWVAIQSADAINADIGFIDLPHWSYRANSHQRALDSAAAPKYTDIKTATPKC